MLVLSATTDNLQVVLAGAITTNQLRCVSSWRDIDTTTYTPGRTVVNTNNATEVVIVGGPVASTQRVIDFISIYNSDTVNATVTVKLDADGTDYELSKVTLAPTERLEYAEGAGFRVYDAAGAQKSTSSTIALGSVKVVQLIADVTNNNGTANTIADVTGLSFPVVSGKRYWFRFMIAYTAAIGSTGSRWSVNGPSATFLSYHSEYSLTTTTKTLNESLSAYDNPAASNATSPTTGANIAVVEGVVVPSANGTLIARFASEVSGSAIVAKAGSICTYVES